MGTHGKEYPHGYNVHRSCTDIIFLFAFFAFWVGMFVVASVAFANGNLSRLSKGTDAVGNLCGMANQPNVPAASLLSQLPAAQGATWEERGLLWFPVYPDLQLTAIRRMGICVKACPPFTHGVDVQNLLTNPANLTYVHSYTDDASRFPVLYKSQPILNRCLPVLEDAETILSLVATLDELQPAIEAGNWVYRVIQSLIEVDHVILICIATALAFCFVWVLLMRFLLGPIVYLTLLLVLVLLFALASFFYTHGKQVGADPTNAQYRFAESFRIAGIVTFCFASAYACMLCFLLGRIHIAIDLLELACRVMGSIKSLVLLPPLMGIAFVALTLWCVYVAAMLRTAATLSTEDLDLPALPAALAQKGASAGNLTVTFLEQPESRNYLLAFYWFGYLWTSGFISAASVMIIAFCTVFWYFSVPGDDKSPPAGAVLIAVYYTLRYHVGTLAFGSFIIAVVQFIRWLATKAEDHLKRLLGDDTLVKFIACCIQCILAYIERVLKFINKNAYIVTCIEGSNFCSSAATALKLIVANVLRVGTLTFITEWVIIFMKVLITASNVFFANILLSRTNLSTDQVDFAPALLLIGFLTFLIASVFLNVFATVADAVLLCFCYDDDVNNGKDRPYFMTSDLLRVIGKHNKSARPDGYSAMEGTEMQDRKK
eukprot:TRINITY_DN22014_c0_g3_i1.p1 TRINITY_DN22014_c0_g3~~TRINITY_DN22014_c0_g3_i1.p1  ORF type:complete len:658 (+),score=179.65 TRINITY_DN22014_c0_g3_i1:66-2039(+)